MVENSNILSQFATITHLLPFIIIDKISKFAKRKTGSG
jgi:hypothetical protein